jgi:uncharacterized membrane protein YbhN (UPF0104 family)
MHLADLNGFGPRLAALTRQRWVAMGASATILGLIFWRIHPERIGSALAGMRWSPAMGALLCVIGAGGLLAIRWRWMLKVQGVNDGLWAAWRGVWVGNAFNAAMLGAVLSDVAKSAWYVRRYGHSFPAVLLGCGLDRMCGGLGVILYGIATVLVAFKARPHLWGQIEFHLSGAPVFVGVAIAVAVVALVKRFGRDSSFSPRLIEFRRRIHEAWTELRTRPSILVSAIVLSFVANLFVGGTLACGLAAVGPRSIDWPSILWTLPVIGLAASVPFSIAGAGAREGAAIALWSAYGISAPQAVAACLLTLTATLLGALPGALLFLRTREASLNPPAGPPK